MSGTVTVACKLPGGLHLDMPGRPRVTIGGTALPVGVVLDAHQQKRMQSINFGYALTPGVDEEFWEAWLEDHKTMDIVQRRMIFAYEKPNDTRAAARECEGEKSGLEPMDPDKPGKGLEKVVA